MGKSKQSVKQIHLKLYTVNISVAAHMRGMRPAPTTKKHTLMLRKNSNTNTINQTFKYALLDYF